MARPLALSGRNVTLLEALPSMAGDLVFPGNKGNPLSDMSLLAVVKRMKVDAVPHGFRSTFRDWAAERTAYPQHVAEMALALTLLAGAGLLIRSFVGLIQVDPGFRPAGVLAVNLALHW